MKVLVACEFSGVVRDAFIRRGHAAVSCDLLDTDAPGPHIVGDVREVLNGGGWDLLIAHPPCTDLAVSGASHFAAKRADGRQQRSIEFFLTLANADVPCIMVENPVGIMSTIYRKPDQIIQPWQFGHDASKSTCLWLKGLSLLQPTQAVDPQFSCCGVRFPYALGVRGCPNCNGEHRARPVWGNQTPSGQNRLGPSAERWKLRSITYTGIAEAMAEQWG